MHGRQLATIQRIIAIVSPGSDEATEKLQNWANEQGIPLQTVDVGDGIESVYDSSDETLGITIGGDGTFLEGIKQFAPRHIPILGINTGSLAFLVRVGIDDIEEALTEVIRGRSTIDKRQQLHVEADGKAMTGINDVMIKHVPPANPVDRKISRLHVFADSEYVGEYDGNGIAISTPTGSTGVSLSANGPIHYPKNNESLQIVPLHTHRMGARPLILDHETEMQVITEEEATLLVDGGRHHVHLEATEQVTVTGSDIRANVIRTSLDDHFFTAISELLGWGLRDGEGRNPPTSNSSDGPTSTVAKALQVATEAAHSVGEPLRELHGSIQDVQFKTNKADVVTEADFISENIIVTAIENEFPSHNIRSEENANRETGSEYTWLLDPLDGTGNYANGNPNYSVSIALLKDEEPVMGVVYAPEMDELFSAIKGNGANLDGHQITTTDRGSLDESVVMSGYDPDGTFLTHFYQETRGVRRLGSAALHLCYLANGSADAIWEHDTYPWDTAAGSLIASEAGAKLTDSTGTTYDISRPEGTRNELLGTNGHIHQEILDHLNTNAVLPSD